MIIYTKEDDKGTFISFAGEWDDIQEAVDITKRTVPSANRTYLKEARIWYVLHPYDKRLLEAFEQEAWDVEEAPDYEPSTREQGRAATARPANVPASTEHFEAIFRATRPELREPLRKALMMVLHPDRAGDATLMTALNIAWERQKA